MTDLENFTELPKGSREGVFSLFAICHNRSILKGGLIKRKITSNITFLSIYNTCGDIKASIYCNKCGDIKYSIC